MRRPLFALAVLALLARDAGAQPAMAEPTVAASRAADSLGARARPGDAHLDATLPDSLAGAARTASGATAKTATPPGDSAGVRLRLDPLWTWATWPDIGPAIALETLDGPADILEKEEIIADRIDALVAEDGRLDTVEITWRDRSLALAAQLEVLEDLAGLQIDGDLESQQRLDAIRQDLLEAQRLVARVEGSRAGLSQQLVKLQALSLDYRTRAARLRTREERR
jgi:hypothetical protein